MFLLHLRGREIAHFIFTVSSFSMSLILRTKAYVLVTNLLALSHDEHHAILLPWNLLFAFELGTNLVTIPYAGNYCVEYGIFSVYIAIEIQTKFDLKKQKS